MLGKIFNQITEHAKQNNVCAIAVFFDYIHARLRYGFCGEDYFLNTPGYAWKNITKKQYFSHKAWLKLRKQFNNADYAHILNNKVETLKYFRHSLNHEWCYPNEESFEEFSKFISKHQQRIICKPVDEEGGKGIDLYQGSASKQAYDELKRNNLLLEECIVQHPSMCFGNKSVNTIRVYSVLDRNNKAHILKAVLRAGVGQSVVDNFHSGGVIYPVNVEHGFIESFGVRRQDKSGVYIHPGTDIVMLGFNIPNWGMLKERVIEMAESLPQVRYIGWDMVITQDGVDMIEANENADHALFGRIGCEKLFLNKLKSML